MFYSFMKTDMMDSVYLINYRSMICLKSSIKEMQEITGSYYSYLCNFYMINGQNVENVASTNHCADNISSKENNKEEEDFQRIYVCIG